MCCWWISGATAHRQSLMASARRTPLLLRRQTWQRCAKAVHAGSSDRLGLHDHREIPRIIVRWGSRSCMPQLMRSRTDGAGPDMLIGHSLGGKVLLQYLAQGGIDGLPLPKQASSGVTGDFSAC
jgi:hypothetical protein